MNSKKMKTIAQKEKKRKYQRNWRLKNLEKTRKSARERARKRYKKMSPESRAKLLKKNRIRRRLKYRTDAKWRKKIYKKSREYVEKNREKVREYYKTYHQKVTKPKLASHPRIAQRIRKRNKKYSHDHFRDKKRRRWTKKKITMSYYSTSKQVKCVRCGEKRIKRLTFDHIRGRKSMGHDKTMTGEKLYNWIIRIYKKTGKPPKGLQIMCLKHNFKKQINKMRDPAMRKEAGLRFKNYWKKKRKNSNSLRMKIHEKMISDPIYLKKVLAR